jgi:tRNA(fMet)-specific endonuclease VapC
MYLIDTDVTIYAMKGNAVVLSHLKRTATAPEALSVITYGELYYGAMKSARRQKNLARIRRISQLFPVVELSKAIMETFGSLKAETSPKGTSVDDFDLVVAATALTLNYTLVTNNERHFRNIPGLAVENWSKVAIE